MRHLPFDQEKRLHQLMEKVEQSGDLSQLTPAEKEEWQILKDAWDDLNEFRPQCPAAFINDEWDTVYTTPRSDAAW